MESKLLYFYDVGKKVNAIRMLKVEIPGKLPKFNKRLEKYKIK